MDILVIGGTLFIGRVLVAKLRAAGHRVTVLHRKPTHDLGDGIASLTADRNDPAAVRSAIAGHEFDAVFDNVYDWTRGTTAEQVVATAEACRSPKLRRYIFMSSVAAYGEGLVCAEDRALAPDDHPDLYVRNKAMSERALFALRGLPAVTLRPPFIYGPGNPYDRETFFWRRFAAGRPVLVPDRGEWNMQFIHVDDLADCALRCLDADAAVGQAFNVADQPITQLDFVRLTGEVVGITTPDIRGVPRAEIQKRGGSAMGPAERRYFAEYFDLPPIGQDTNKAARLLGFKARPLRQGLAETYRTWHPQTAIESFAFEDELLAVSSRLV